MSEPCCAFIKSDGHPCAARSLPDRPFCLFHDPAQAEALAQARRKGGATPRRRLRRYPRVLDHFHVAELLSELLMDAVNAPGAVDPNRLQAITHLARTLLTAVGTPPHEYLEYNTPAEPAPSADHLLRVYPPLPPDVVALLEAELPSTRDAELVPAATAQPPAPPVPTEAPHAPTAPACPSSPDPSGPSDLSDLPDPSEPPPVLPPSPPAREQDNGQDAEQDNEQDNEQDTNRTAAGHPATDAAHPLPLNAGPPEHPHAADPTPALAPAPLNAQDHRFAAVPPEGPNAPTPDPRHLLVDPHAPWPGPDSPSPGHIIVDFPFGPTSPNVR